MKGILGYGTYLPYYRLKRESITAALGSGGGRGTRAAASFDEDTTTMGVEAARAALRSLPDVTPTSLWFATANPAYQDKTNASAIHAALDLPRAGFAVDCGGAARSGTGAIVAAHAADGPSLAILSDLRVGMPGGADESNGGDGAAAIVFGDDSHAPVIATVVGGGSTTGEFLDRYRQPGDGASRVWEERFGEHAYLPLVEQAVTDALKSAELSPDQLDKVIVTGLSARAVRSAGRLVGAAAEAYVDDLSATIGNTSTAHQGIMLASALDTAEPGQVIAVVHLADGCDVGLLHTTDAIADYQPASTIEQQIARGDDSLDYAKYLTWRGMLDREPPRRPDPDRPAAPPSLRSEDWKYGFIGSKDRSSGAIHLPPMRVSMEGGAVDDMEPIRMADTPATIATYTIDRLAFSLSPPVVAAVIDFDGGGRFQVEMTDVDPDAVAIGDRVEMTFRRLFTAQGVHNYFWKARPIPA